MFRAAVVLLRSCCVLVLLVPTCSAQGSDCSCNATNSHCDETRVCRCDPGWDGKRCERCVLMPGCVHGSCQQPWQCSCDPGWGGRFCDKDLSVCSERPCDNGATCVMQDGGEFTCLCPEGFHGRKCHLKTGPCHQRRSPCQHGGLCEDADGFAAEWACRCLAGFTGRRCETDVDDCLMTPCGNGATCLDGVNRFSCLCPAGVTGRFCRIKAVNIINEPRIFKGIFAIIKPFLKEKMAERYILHGSDLRSLHRNIPRSVLPEEYGGTAGQLDMCPWSRLLLDCEEEFIVEFCQPDPLEGVVLPDSMLFEGEQASGQDDDTFRGLRSQLYYCY